MEMKKLRNTNNKLIDLMGICLSQELLQALELDRHKLEEYVINGTLNSNNLFVYSCYFLEDGNSLAVLERFGRFSNTPFSWMTAFLNGYIASAFYSNEIGTWYHFVCDPFFDRKPTLTLPRALGCRHESFANDTHRLLLGREGVSDVFCELSPLDQKELFGIISGAVDYMETFYNAYPNVLENEESKMVRQSLITKCKEAIEFIKTHLKREDIFLRSVVVLTADEQTMIHNYNAREAILNDYDEPVYDITMVEKACCAKKMSEEANYNGDIETIITEMLDPDLFLQFIHTACDLYAKEAGIGAGKLHFSPDENVNISYIPIYERGYATKINNMLGVKVPFFPYLCSGDQKIICEEFDHSIRRVDEIYTRLMEDPSYSGVKERWQKALEEMSGMVATMQVEMEAANSTTDQTGVKRGGKVSN